MVDFLFALLMLLPYALVLWILILVIKALKKYLRK